MTSQVIADTSLYHAEANDARRRSSVIQVEKKQIDAYDQNFDHDNARVGEVTIGDDLWPTEEEQAVLRRIPDKVPFMAYTVAFVELCERFSYYGSTQVFSAFLQYKPAPGHPAGDYAFDSRRNHGGALGLGTAKKSAIVQFFQFWCYCTPILGAYIADTYWGRYKTIMWAIGLAMIGHIFLILSSVPSITASSPEKTGLGLFLGALIVMGAGTGGFKPNISPLIADQIKGSKMAVRVLPSGERVIVDPVLTIARLYMYFYLMINIGALMGQLGMSYAEKYVGFWLSYTLPTIMFGLCPAVLVACRNRYRRTPPTGSVLGKSLRLWFYAQKGRWSLNPIRTYKNINDGTFWTAVKPSNIAPENRPGWMTFDDAWVDEVRRGFKACNVFCWFPLYWLTYNQISNQLTTQAGTMNTHNLPADVLGNINSFAIIILIPVFDLGLYPLLRRFGINFSPLKKILFGFITGVLAMLWAGIVQWYIYKLSKCGYYATNCSEDPDTPSYADINVWWQTGSYVLISVSEIFASITGLEYAYTKAPTNMKSLVMSLFLFTSAISTALGLALNPLVQDPMLIWNFGVAGGLCLLGAIGFWWMFHTLDKQEDDLNALVEGKFEN